MKIVLCVAFFLMFGLMLIHGIVVAVRWWQGGTLAQWEYGLLAVLPVLLYLFLTRYSIFKKDCPSCQFKQSQE